MTATVSVWRDEASYVTLMDVAVPLAAKQAPAVWVTGSTDLSVKKVLLPGEVAAVMTLSASAFSLDKGCCFFLPGKVMTENSTKVCDQGGSM